MLKRNKRGLSRIIVISIIVSVLIIGGSVGAAVFIYQRGILLDSEDICRGKKDGELVSLNPDSEEKLENAVRKQGDSALKIISDSKCLGSLTLSSSGISNISYLSNLTNLRGLNLNNNEISDISPLSNLTNLEVLVLSNNKISDISSLNNLTNLERLHLSGNNISSSECKELKENIEIQDSNLYC